MKHTISAANYYSPCSSLRGNALVIYQPHGIRRARESSFSGRGNHAVLGSPLRRRRCVCTNQRASPRSTRRVLNRRPPRTTTPNKSTSQERRRVVVDDVGVETAPARRRYFCASRIACAGNRRGGRLFRRASGPASAGLALRRRHLRLVTAATTTGTRACPLAAQPATRVRRRIPPCLAGSVNVRSEAIRK